MEVARLEISLLDISKNSHGEQRRKGPRHLLETVMIKKIDTRGFRNPEIAFPEGWGKKMTYLTDGGRTETERNDGRKDRS